MSDEAALFGSAQIITPKYFRMITRSISSLPDEKIPTMKRTTSPNDESNTVSRLTILPDILSLCPFGLVPMHHTHVDTAVDVEA
jgi:hypothetical protein